MVQWITLGDRHSVEDREKYVSEYSRLSSQNPCVAIHTCNRLEIYYGEGPIPEPLVSHLFRVVSGLESNLLGEIAIQGQVKAAYLQASSTFRLSKSLHCLFQYALHVGKRVKTESAISRGAISHSQAVLELIVRSGIDLNKALITIIGTHKLNEDIVRYLKAKGAETIFLANRNFEKAQHFASQHECKALRLDQLREFLGYTDILISATSAPHLIVKESDFPAGKEMLIFDLAFPRDVAPSIGNQRNVTLYNVEHVERQVNQNREHRKAEMEKAEEIIRQETKRFFEKRLNLLPQYEAVS